MRCRSNIFGDRHQERFLMEITSWLVFKVSFHNLNIGWDFFDFPLWLLGWGILFGARMTHQACFSFDTCFRPYSEKNRKMPHQDFIEDKHGSSNLNNSSQTVWLLLGVFLGFAGTHPDPFLIDIEEFCNLFWLLGGFNKNFNEIIAQRKFPRDEPSLVQFACKVELTGLAFCQELSACYWVRDTWKIP